MNGGMEESCCSQLRFVMLGNSVDNLTINTLNINTFDLEGSCELVELCLNNFIRMSDVALPLLSRTCTIECTEATKSQL